MKLARVRTPVVARLNLYNSLYLFQKSSSMDLMKLTLRRDSYHKAAAVRTGNNVAGMRRDAFLAQCNLNYVQYVFGCSICSCCCRLIKNFLLLNPQLLPSHVRVLGFT